MLVVMLVYLIWREPSRAWAGLDVTVQEGLHQLQTLVSTEMKVKGSGSCLRIPIPQRPLPRSAQGARAFLI